LDNAYRAVIDSITGAAQDHIKLADSLVAQVIDPLKLVETKNEATKKKASVV
jgi:formin-binding protein 1